HLIKVAVNAQIKKVEALEKKVEAVETRLDAEVVHLKNELCQQKYIMYQSSCIITGLKITKSSSHGTIDKAIRDVLYIAGIKSAGYCLEPH
ncbi:unnamed protein product, partial [Allacma fusca]